MLLQALLSLLVFLRFVKNNKKRVAIIDRCKHQEVYFQQLRQNWT